MSAGRGFVEQDPVQRYPPGVKRQKTRQRAEQRGLAGAVGAHDDDDLPRGHRDIDIQMNLTNASDDLRLEAHPAPSQRSRSPTNTASEITSNTRLSMTAASGLVSSAR